MISIPLAESFCPNKWRQAIDIMVETLVPRINKLRIIQLLEADLNQFDCISRVSVDGKK
jgi:hypothetical protein